MPKQTDVPAGKGGRAPQEGVAAKAAPGFKRGFDPASLRGPKGFAGGKGPGGPTRRMLPGKSGNR